MTEQVAGPQADGTGLATVRERFLNNESIAEDTVRDEILASWWRSRWLDVAADRIELPYLGNPDQDTPLTRSAMPVLRQLHQHLDGQPISIVLTDSTGLVLTRMMAHRDLDSHLDSVQLAPGFSYAEEFVGTNGIGTALEGGRPMDVFGHEHYAEHLEQLACAGVPIRHPVSGKTIGAVDLTCWRRDASPLLITLAKTTADQIMGALLAESSSRELALLRDYQRACRRQAGIVFAIDDDLMMVNEYARQVLDPGDQSVLVGLAVDALAGRRSRTVEVELPSGVSARLQCRPVSGHGRPGAGIAQVKLVEAADPVRAGAVAGGASPLPGLIGSGRLWVRACQLAQFSQDRGEWLAAAGEPGAGKVAILRAVYQRRHPGGRVRVLEHTASPELWTGTVRLELLDGHGCLVIRNVDRLERARVVFLTELLRGAAASGRHPPWVAITLSGPAAGDELAGLMRSFPATVEVPPLRHHIEDVPELVRFFLGRLNPDGGLYCSPEAMQLMLRSTWPGNIEQLWRVLRRVAQRRRTGAIGPGDLPPECRTVSRRLLSPLESMERDAIVHSLRDTGGSKTKAAKALGMSRATIYRKVHEYGIVEPF